MPVTNPHNPKLYDWAHYKAQPSDWMAVTREHVYEDGTKTFNELADYAPQRWTIRYTGMTADERALLDAHFEEVRYSRTFTFVDKDGYTHPDCYYEAYQSSHDGHRSWTNQIEITIVQYDASNVESPPPSVPTGLTAETGGASGEVDIDWTESTDGGGGVAGYVLRIRVPD